MTSHRLLAFTPDREGPNYRTVDRPNVEGVDVRTSGEGSSSNRVSRRWWSA
ncbi:hypothetical protein ACFQH8_02280 [Halomicroarcula sp. GCM10025710]